MRSPHPHVFDIAAVALPTTAFAHNGIRPRAHLLKGGDDDAMMVMMMMVMTTRTVMNDEDSGE